MKILKFKKLKHLDEKGYIVKIDTIKEINNHRYLIINGEPYILENKRMKAWFDMFKKGFSSIDSCFPSYAELCIAPNGNYCIELLDNDKKYIKSELTDMHKLYINIAKSIVEKDLEEE